MRKRLTRLMLTLLSEITASAYLPMNTSAFFNRLSARRMRWGAIFRAWVSAWRFATKSLRGTMGASGSKATVSISAARFTSSYPKSNSKRFDSDVVGATHFSSSPKTKNALPLLNYHYFGGIQFQRGIRYIVKPNAVLWRR